MNCQSRNLIPCVNLHTRITESSSTCLSHIWSGISMPNISGALQTDITDHFLVFVCYPGYFAPNEGCQKLGVENIRMLKLNVSLMRLRIL